MLLDLWFLNIHTVDKQHGIYSSKYGDFELSTKFAIMSDKYLFSNLKIGSTLTKNSDKSYSMKYIRFDKQLQSNTLDTLCNVL